MAYPQSTWLVPPAQRPKSGYGFLRAVLDGIDDVPLLDRLQQYRQTGRPGYSLRAMWRAYVSKFVLKIRFNLDLLERLRGNRQLREICGFGDDVPSESAFSRFTTRLTDHQDLVERCFRGATDALRGLVPAVKRQEGKQDQPLPPLGAVLAIDSTLFETYSNPSRPVVSDPDARWGVKHSSRAKDDDTEWGFGYKMHLISDATYGIPLAFTVTPANENDSIQLPGVLRKTLDAHSWMEPGCLLADRGYDSLTNHEFVYDLGITPVIHIRKPTAKDGLYDGIYTESGKPTCMGGEAMEYVRTDPETGAHLFRCRAGGCPLKAVGSKAIAHCDSEVWENPESNLRVLGPLPRFLPAWKRLYSQRMSIERIFRSLKHSRGLEGHMVRGMKKVSLLATMSLLTYQATVLARVKAKDFAGMRRMRVKVA